MNKALFSSLNLKTELHSSLETLDYKTMTAVQSSSLPYILEDRDVIVQGKTGSGKTLAFALGLLNKLNSDVFVIQSIIICPTRELAHQVANEIRLVARMIPNTKILCLTGGVPISPQLTSLAHGTHIVVGTPGRLNDHLSKGSLSLTAVKTLVLDEADRMLSMGFAQEIKSILKQIPVKRQTLLFSATYPDSIASLANSIMTDPFRCTVSSTHDNTSIEQHLYKVDDDAERLLAVRLLLHFFRPESAIIFCNTIIDVNQVSKELNKHGFCVLPLHGELDQQHRDQTLIQFSNKSISIIVATDVAARGLNIESVDVVINYHTARNPDSHIHRIGRTGRTTKKGIACSLYAEKEIYKISLLVPDFDPVTDSEALPAKTILKNIPATAQMATLKINLGKKHKIRAGDIVGTLTNSTRINAVDIGKINLAENWAYIAVAQQVKKFALEKLNGDRIKGRRVKASKIDINV